MIDFHFGNPQTLYEVNRH